MLNFRHPWSRVRVWCWRPNDGRTDCSFYLQKEKENEIRHFYCQGLGQWTVPDNNYRVLFFITLSPEFPLGTCASFSFCFEGLQNEIGARDVLQTATSDKRSNSRRNPLPWRRNVEGILCGMLYKLTLDLDIVFGRLSEEISQVQISLPKIIMKLCVLQWNACTFKTPSPPLQCWAQNQIPTCEINSWETMGPESPKQEDETLQHWNWGEGARGRFTVYFVFTCEIYSDNSTHFYFNFWILIVWTPLKFSALLSMILFNGGLRTGVSHLYIYRLRVLLIASSQPCSSGGKGWVDASLC